MIIEDRARELWAKFLDDALRGEQYQALLVILTEEKARIHPIPARFLIDSLQSFFPNPPSRCDTLHALIEMGFTSQEKE